MTLSPLTTTGTNSSLTAVSAAAANAAFFTTIVITTLPHSAVWLIMSSLFKKPVVTRLSAKSFVTAIRLTVLQSRSSTIFTSVGTTVVEVDTDVVVDVWLWLVVVEV